MVFMIGRIRLPAATFLAVIALAGCATERQVALVIESAPRSSLRLETPVIGAVFDDRSSTADKDASSNPQGELSRLCGPAIE